jgi:hypothetical protein
MMGKRWKITKKNSWFDEECKIILEDKKRVYNKMINKNTKQNKQEHKLEIKKHLKYLDKKKVSIV